MKVHILLIYSFAYLSWFLLEYYLMFQEAGTATFIRKMNIVSEVFCVYYTQNSTTSIN